MDPEDELEQIERQMQQHATRHAHHMRAWHALRPRRDRLRVIVELRRLRDLREARRYCGPSAVRSG